MTPTNDLALVDPLVPLKNRRAFDSDAALLFDAHRHGPNPLALVRIDVDHFKAVNDQHGGHVVGDEVLIAIAQVLDSCVRGKGTAYRVGGDEFALLLPNHTVAEATAVAERVRRAVNERPMTSRALTLSVSVGVAVHPDHGEDIGSLGSAADTASYDAKNLGRNLVRVFGEPAPSAPGNQREVERRHAEPGALTEQERTQIRTDYFRFGRARCPMDDAVLHVNDVSGFGDKVNVIHVSCPVCGLKAQLP